MKKSATSVFAQIYTTTSSVVLSSHHPHLANCFAHSATGEFRRDEPDEVCVLGRYYSERRGHPRPHASRGDMLSAVTRFRIRFIGHALLLVHPGGSGRHIVYRTGIIRDTSGRCVMVFETDVVEL